MFAKDRGSGQTWRLVVLVTGSELEITRLRKRGGEVLPRSGDRAGRSVKR